MARPSMSQQNELIVAVHDHGINFATREIFLNSNPDNKEDGIDYACASTFIRNIAILDSLNKNPILVHMCICGGEWNYGMAIYDAIKASPSFVTVLAYAHARSMSSIIPQAADRRVITPNADFLIHHGTMEVSGDTKSVIAESNWAKYTSEVMIDIYATKCVDGPYFRQRNMSKDDIKEKFLRKQMDERREVYFTPGEAVDYGFMDGILGAPDYEDVATLLK